MNQIYPDVGVANLLRIVTGLDTVAGMYWHLYANNYTPTLNTVITDLTEASWVGYAAQQVLPAAFTLAGVVAHVAFRQSLPVAFSNNDVPNQLVYGYYITRTAAADLIAVARFDGAPLMVPGGGGNLHVVPIFGDYSALSS